MASDSTKQAWGALAGGLVSGFTGSLARGIERDTAQQEQEKVRAQQLSMQQQSLEERKRHNRATEMERKRRAVGEMPTDFDQFYLGEGGGELTATQRGELMPGVSSYLNWYVSEGRPKVMAAGGPSRENLAKHVLDPYSQRSMVEIPKGPEPKEGEKATKSYNTLLEQGGAKFDEESGTWRISASGLAGVVGPLGFGDARRHALEPHLKRADKGTATRAQTRWGEKMTRAQMSYVTRRYEADMERGRRIAGLQPEEREEDATAAAPSGATAAPIRAGGQGLAERVGSETADADERYTSQQDQMVAGMMDESDPKAQRAAWDRAETTGYAQQHDLRRPPHLSDLGDDPYEQDTRAIQEQVRAAKRRNAAVEAGEGPTPTPSPVRSVRQMMEQLSPEERQEMAAVSQQRTAAQPQGTVPAAPGDVQRGSRGLSAGMGQAPPPQMPAAGPGGPPMRGPTAGPETPITPRALSREDMRKPRKTAKMSRQIAEYTMRKAETLMVQAMREGDWKTAVQWENLITDIRKRYKFTRAPTKSPGLMDQFAADKMMLERHARSIGSNRR